VRKQTTAAGLIMMTGEDSKMPNVKESSGLPKVEVACEAPTVGEDFKKLKLGELSELPKVGLMKTPGINSWGIIPWPTQWGDNLMANTTGLVIRLKDATVKYTMERTLLIISEANIDVVRIRPHKQQVIKVEGSNKTLTTASPQSTPTTPSPPVPSTEPLVEILSRTEEEMWPERWHAG
jgi:hypothetical protein